MKRIGSYVFGLLVLGIFITAPVQGQGWTDDGSVVRLTTSTDNVGIGTSAPSMKLDIGGWADKPANLVAGVVSIGGPDGGDLFFGNTGGNSARMRFASNFVQGLLQWNLYYHGSGSGSMDASRPSYEIDLNSNIDAFVFRRYAPGPQAPEVLLTLGGTGNLVTKGSVSGASVVATYQDVAEWVPSTTELEPGTVVVLNPTKNNEIMASHAEYDTMVAGVVSAQPGLILGVSGDEKEMVATTGRVKVRVDATAAPIAVGDLLVTSSKPGMAMKSQPISMQGRSFHQPGTIIGKALEPLKEGQGEILVLLSMQ